ncbi:hypothetical protein L7F22_039673 [Adiantum nelumboides]|nr:hypothetical protein [Adiantum nelumboides]
MTRIYFKPQGASNRAGFNKSRKPNFKSSHLQQDHHPRKEIEGTQKRDDGWRSKLEPNSIEQIADGLEKMVLSWTNQPHKMPHSDPDFTYLHAHDDSHSLLPSDAIKSATTEFVDEGDQFSIGTKETTISFVHHHEQHQNHQGFKPAAPSHNQQTLIVDTIGDPDGFMQDIMKGDILKNGLLSIQNGDCTAADYHQMDNTVRTSALWYLTPTLALPNTVSYGKDYATAQQKSEDFQQFTCVDGEDDGYHITHDEFLRHNGDKNRSFLRGEREENGTVFNRSAVFHEEKLHRDSTMSEKISCKLEALGSKIWSETVEINGGTKIKDLLGRKLVAMGNGFPFPKGTGNSDADYFKKKIEELQIALLECAMEYEVKIVEMKMNALHSKSQERQIAPEKDKSKEELESGHPENLKDKRDAQRVDYLKKQLSRLQREKATAARELSDLRKRERQFDLQRRSLDDALSRVNYLQSELARKEQDIVDCRLREKEAKAHLYELQLGLQKAQAAQIEPRKLMTLLPALKDWIQSSKKVSHDVGRADNHEKAEHASQIDNIVHAITKEIRMLQNALSHVIHKT